MSNIILTFLVLVLLIGGFSYTSLGNKTTPAAVFHKITKIIKPTASAKSVTTGAPFNSPLGIENMRNKSYPGSVITVEQTLAPTASFNSYIVSYTSEGLKLYGLLTVPIGTKPKGGWPVILFNHGYIPPASYSTMSSYAIMVDPLASAEFIVFKPDYRGNGNSQGTPTQSYITPDYVTDSMNALSSIKNYKDANPNEIGVFGHSMGGNITLHELVMTHDFKAAELMAGTVGNETQLIQWWNQRIANHSIVGNDLDTSKIVEQMVQQNGTPTSNSAYWNAIDPTKFISYINTPVQIQVGSADEEVPTDFSSTLNSSLQSVGKLVDYHVYQGADHNLSPDTSAAMAATVEFFNKYLKSNK
jgi:dipeptidyl aminopeptidase/acylaminoacyl peptidase